MILDPRRGLPRGAPRGQVNERHISLFQFGVVIVCHPDVPFTVFVLSFRIVQLFGVGTVSNTVSCIGADHFNFGNCQKLLRKPVAIPKPIRLARGTPASSPRGIRPGQPEPKKTVVSTVWWPSDSPSPSFPPSLGPNASCRKTPRKI